jgi:ribosomal protein S18 acetylase RimI-like enzyme
MHEVMGMIRQMAISDYEDVWALWGRTEGMGLNDVDDSRAGIEKYLLRNPNTCFVSMENGALNGVILAGHDGRRGYIHHTAVEKSARGTGLGRALVEAAIEALQTEGISKVALVVFSRNQIGNGFWEKMGFSLRADLNYRNRALRKLVRMDT